MSVNETMKFFFQNFSFTYVFNIKRISKSGQRMLAVDISVNVEQPIDSACFTKQMMSKL